jgi:hypothetical protein
MTAAMTLCLRGQKLFFLGRLTDSTAQISITWRQPSAHLSPSLEGHLEPTGLIFWAHCCLHKQVHYFKVVEVVALSNAIITSLKPSLHRNQGLQNSPSAHLPNSEGWDKFFSEDCQNRYLAPLITYQEKFAIKSLSSVSSMPWNPRRATRYK